ncbi:F0F1 ATP synthase subunit A [Gorillibacterium timonense]|uniref:F0F1 ATP synthase subunit A n=1 Tax=Gorillibacterium timonense TaxID=1689269 RepID=UPI00071DF2BF|nr:F0F1 ATP synthase subunit A [Gorillibacterium timonense]
MHEFPIWDLGHGLQVDIAGVLTILVACIIVFVLARLSVRNLSVTHPSKMQNFMEWVVEFVRDMVASTQDLKTGKKYVSLAMTLIMFIFVSNLLGLPLLITTEHHHPLVVAGHTLVSQEVIDEAIQKGHEGAEVSWWKSPTADLSVTAGLALIVTVIIHLHGVTRNTKHYLKHYFEPYFFFFPLNLLETLAKPLTLALRLFANIFAGEVLISTITMAGFFGIPLMLAWQGFSIFVGAIQAFLFTILTLVYIAQATVHEEEHA